MIQPVPPAPGSPRPSSRRLLFLDDDPLRAEVFLAEYPEAVWVQTASECLERLAEEWDEVHLDHDLGGEHFVDLSREDCGMEVVRWLCLEPRPHLDRTKFLVHSHNIGAAMAMLMHMYSAGYQVEARPFGTPPPPPAPDPPASRSRSRWKGRLDRLRELFLRLAHVREAPPTPGGDRNDFPDARVEPPGP